MTDVCSDYMEGMRGLINRLKTAGLDISTRMEKALLTVCIEDFTDFDCELFYNDRPVVFLETNFGGVKTISAPHMIVTLIYNLELNEGQQVIILGAKGGYIAALIAHIIGEEGNIKIFDPSLEVINHVSNKLRGYPTVECNLISEFDENDFIDMNRILITGQVNELPHWVSDSLSEGGFAIAPIGNKDNQMLMKVEKQEGSLFYTEMGPVVFGPLDIKDSIIQAPTPIEMAELVEYLIELMTDMSIIDNNEKIRLFDLVAKLRQLPDDMPPPEEFEDPSEHPMYQLMIDEGEWFMRFWPFVQLMAESRIANPGGFDNDIPPKHDDFIA